MRVCEEGKNTTSVNKISINKSSLLRCEQCVFLGYLIYVYIGFLFGIQFTVEYSLIRRPHGLGVSLNMELYMVSIH